MNKNHDKKTGRFTSGGGSAAAGRNEIAKNYGGKPVPAWSGGSSSAYDNYQRLQVDLPDSKASGSLKADLKKAGWQQSDVKNYGSGLPKTGKKVGTAFQKGSNKVEIIKTRVTVTGPKKAKAIKTSLYD